MPVPDLHRTPTHSSRATKITRGCREASLLVLLLLPLLARLPLLLRGLRLKDFELRSPRLLRQLQRSSDIVPQNNVVEPDTLESRRDTTDRDINTTGIEAGTFLLSGARGIGAQLEELGCTNVTEAGGPRFRNKVHHCTPRTKTSKKEVTSTTTAEKAAG